MKQNLKELTVIVALYVVIVMGLNALEEKQVAASAPRHCDLYWHSAQDDLCFVKTDGQGRIIPMTPTDSQIMQGILQPSGTVFVMTQDGPKGIK